VLVPVDVPERFSTVAREVLRGLPASCSDAHTPRLLTPSLDLLHVAAARATSRRVCARRIAGARLALLGIEQVPVQPRVLRAFKRDPLAVSRLRSPV